MSPADERARPALRLRFGSFTFDGGRKLLFDGARPVPLSPKAFRLLELLLERRPEAVSKEEILSAVWPDVVVSEASLQVLVADLRKALGESARTSSVVRTVFGFGYAFDGVVEERASAAPEARPPVARHLLVRGETVFELAEGTTVVGRDEECGVCLPDSSVSRRHAQLSVTGDVVVLADLGSKNGTFRNGTRVTEPVPLEAGDVVGFGVLRLEYRCRAAGPGASTRTVG